MSQQSKFNGQVKNTGQSKRTAIYIAPAAYGTPLDMDEALQMSRAYVKKRKNLKLMRIYRDEQVEIIVNGAEGNKRSPLSVKGNDAWKRLLTDIETSAVEAVVIYAARTVAPSISGLANMVRDYFIPCGIRFIDVEAEFDTADGDVNAYLKVKDSEYRSTVKHKPHKPYKKRKKKEADDNGQTKSSSEINTAVLEAHDSSGMENRDLCETV